MRIDGSRDERSRRRKDAQVKRRRRYVRRGKRGGGDR